MSVDPARVRAIADLAAIEVDASELAALTRDVSAIVAYVGQLAELTEVAPPPPEPPGAPPRADTVASPDLAAGPGEFAPAFREGFFLVPRLDAMEQR